MGLATVTKTEWGYHITGDTDPTSVWTDGRKYVQNISFVPSGAADTVLISTTRNLTGPATNAWKTASAGVVGVVQEIHFDGNIPLDNPKVTLSSGTGEVFIYVRSK